MIRAAALWRHWIPVPTSRVPPAQQSSQKASSSEHFLKCLFINRCNKTLYQFNQWQTERTIYQALCCILSRAALTTSRDLFSVTACSVCIDLSFYYKCCWQNTFFCCSDVFLPFMKSLNPKRGNVNVKLVLGFFTPEYRPFIGQSVVVSVKQRQPMWFCSIDQFKHFIHRDKGLVWLIEDKYKINASKFVF